MKAAICREFGSPLQIEEVALAEPGPGEIQVKLAACAICHSDIAFIDGAWGGPLPTVFGHEASGYVEAVGEGVTSPAIGDFVVVTLIRSCGHCHYCAQGAQTACETTFELDENSPLRDGNNGLVGHGLRTGAFAEEVVVHASQAITIDHSIPPDVASLLACGVITGFGAVVNTAKISAGCNVVVIGTGGVGLNAVQASAIGGAATVIAIDVSPKKLEAAKIFGATHTIRATDDNVFRQVRAITNGRGADYVFVTVGAKQAIDSAYKLMCPNGAVILVGMPPNGIKSEIDPSGIAARSQKILGSKMGESRIKVDIPSLVKLYQSGRLKLDELITGRYSLEDINEAIASSRRGDALRNVIMF